MIVFHKVTVGTLDPLKSVRRAVFEVQGLNFEGKMELRYIYFVVPV